MSTDTDLAILETRMNALNDTMKRLELVADRLPNWAVSVMVMGGGVIGFLTNWLITCIR
jgi:hypothetical protein